MQEHHRKAAKDLALYLLITAAVLGPILFALVYDWHVDATVKSVFGVFYTLILFVPVLYRARRCWRLPRFWFGTLALLGMHGGVLLFLSKQEHITVWLLVPIMAIETGTLNLWANDLAKAKTLASD